MDKYKPAGFWIRFLATIIDSVLTMVLGWVIATVINDPNYLNVNAETGLFNPSVSESIANVTYFIVFIIIFTASKFMGSPGKLICGIKVVNPDMTKIGIGKSIGRAFAYIISLLILFIGYLMAGWNKEKKALHDIICNTRVVYRNKN